MPSSQRPHSDNNSSGQSPNKVTRSQSATSSSGSQKHRRYSHGGENNGSNKRWCLVMGITVFACFFTTLLTSTPDRLCLGVRGSADWEFSVLWCWLKRSAFGLNSCQFYYIFVVFIQKVNKYPPPPPPIQREKNLLTRKQKQENVFVSFLNITFYFNSLSMCAILK